MEKDFMTIGEKLSKLRKENGYTQEGLAEKLNVSRQAISKWEADGAFPETDKLIALSKIYNCSVDYLLGNEFYEVKVEEEKVDLEKEKVEKRNRLLCNISRFLINFSYAFFIVQLVLLGLTVLFMIPYDIMTQELSYHSYGEVVIVIPQMAFSLLISFIINIIFISLLRKKYKEKNIKLSFMIVSLVMMIIVPAVISTLFTYGYAHLLANFDNLTATTASLLQRTNSIVEYAFLFEGIVNGPLIAVTVVLCFITQFIKVSEKNENDKSAKKANALCYLLGVGLGVAVNYTLGLGAMYALKEEYKAVEPIRYKAIKKAFLISLICRLVISAIFIVWMMAIFFYVIL